MSTTVEMTFQGGGLRDKDVAAGASIAATKLIHEQTIVQNVFAPATTIAAATTPLYICRSDTAEIVDCEAIVFGAASGDRTVTITLQKSTGGGAFASIMSSTIDIDNTVAVRTAISGVISDVDLEIGDVLQVVTAVGGASGTQPTGLTVALTVRTRPVA